MNALAEAALLPVYPPPLAELVEGEGVWLTGADGRRYLDFASGIAVVGLGHRHPAPLRAAHAQLDRLWHVSNFFATQPAAALAKRLSERFGGAQAFFCNSGAEANEAALKYARKATGRSGVIALRGSFHGRTMGALSATGQPAKRAAFEPLLDGVTFAAPNDVGSLAAAASDQVGLVLLEPVLGEGGVIPLQPEFVAAAADLAHELDALLAFDEVQTGVGRTGSFFAWQRLGVRPALATFGKGLANGLPIGCLLVADEATGAFAVGDHASTFGGNPVVCAAACAVCDTITDELLANVRANGERLAAGLAAMPAVREVRGAGLLLGAVLDRPARPAVETALEAGLICLPAGDEILRLSPPLIVDPADVVLALQILAEALLGS
jgi:acetylornithine/N-succinyldiaminopimelate aminotransferase